MIKTIHVEPIRNREKYLATQPLTKGEVEKAMDYVVAQTRANMEYFGTRFPWSATRGLKYPIIDNIEWTDGFWTGLLWLCYEYTGDEAFRVRAEQNISVLSFLRGGLQADGVRERPAGRYPGGGQADGTLQ